MDCAAPVYASSKLRPTRQTSDFSLIKLGKLLLLRPRDPNQSNITLISRKARVERWEPIVRPRKKDKRTLRKDAIVLANMALVCNVGLLCGFKQRRPLFIPPMQITPPGG